MNLIPRTNSLFFEDLFNDFISRDTNCFKCDIYEKENKYYIEMDVPGVNRENVNIECDKGYLTINISKGEEVNDEDKNYIRRERNFKEVGRSFYVGNVLEEQIKATFKNGTLIIEIPKKEEIETKRIIEIEEN